MKKISTLFCAGVLMSALCAGFVACNEKPQPVQVSNVELAATLALEVGEKQTLTATILPTDAENRTVSWKSEDESIAEVSSSGEVTAAGAGTTTITVTAAEGEKTASCTVTVTAKTEPEPEPQGEDVPFEVYSFGEEFSARWVDLDYYDEGIHYYDGKILIIDSDEDLDKHVEGDYPPIDFSKKTLVLAYGCVSGGFGVKESKFQQVSNRNYVLTLYGLVTGLTGFIEWHAAIVVDKLPSDSKIELETVALN